MSDQPGHLGGVEPVPEVERIAALPLEERPPALADAVRRLEAALEATETRSRQG